MNINVIDKFTKENNGDPINANINIVRMTPKRYSTNFSFSIAVYPHNTPVNNMAFFNIEINGLYKNIRIKIFH